jgi:hypothetical protein
MRADEINKNYTVEYVYCSSLKLTIAFVFILLVDFMLTPLPILSPPPLSPSPIPRIFILLYEKRHFHRTD